LVELVSVSATQIDPLESLTVTWSVNDATGVLTREQCCWGPLDEPYMGSSGTKFSLFRQDSEFDWSGCYWCVRWLSGDSYRYTDTYFGNTYAVFEQSKEIRAWMSAGSYDLRVWASDIYSNKGWTTVGSVNIYGPDTDKKPPSVSLVSISPTTVSRGEVATSARTVTVRWTASDSSSIYRPAASISTFGDPKTSARFYHSEYADRAVYFTEGYYSNTVLVSGDYRNGVFETTVEVPTFATPGVYELSIWGTDVFDNTSSDQPVYGYLTVTE
jgi:hypothetical protein